MAYITVSRVKQLYGGDRLKSAYPQESDLDNLLTGLIQAASGTMDSYFATGGYATPIDTTILGADAKAALDGHLEQVCLGMVLQNLVPAQRGASQGAKSSKNEADNWLNKIADGRLVLPGIPKQTRNRIAVAGTNCTQLKDRIFQAVRGLNRY